MGAFDQPIPPAPETAAFGVGTGPSPALAETQLSGLPARANIEPTNYISMTPLAGFSNPGSTMVADGTNRTGSDGGPDASLPTAGAASDLPAGVKVSVRYSDQPAQALFMPGPDGQLQAVPPPTPDVVISKDGQIHQMTDLSQGMHQNIVIQVEKDRGQQTATAAEEQALNNYLKSDLPRVLQQNADLAPLAQQNVQLSDANNLVAPEARKALDNVAQQPGPDLPPQVEQRMAAMDEAIPPGTQAGIMSGDRARSFYPPVEQQQNDNNDVYADKKMLGGLYSDNKHPYEHVATRADGSHMVGAYGATYKTFSHYVSFALTPAILDKLGHPPDWSKLGKVLAQLKKEDPQAYDDYLKNVAAAQKSGRIDGDLAKRLLPDKHGHFTGAEHLGQFMAKLQGGKGHISAAELKQNMSSKTQEAMATQLVNDYRGMGANASKIALAVGLDKTPQELTAQDLAGAKGKSLSASAEKFYKLALASQHAGKDDAVAFHVTGDPASPMAYQLAKHFMDHARSSTPGGWCAAGLQESMCDAGLSKWLGSGNAWQMAQAMLRSGEFVIIDPKYARPGDIVAKKHASGNSGHIEGIAAETKNGYLLASDFHHYKQDLTYTNGGYYAKTEVLRYVGPGGAKRDSSANA